MRAALVRPVAVSAALAALALAACGSGTGQATATDSGGSAAASSAPDPGPAAAVNAYYASLQANDCAAAFGVLADPLRATVSTPAGLCGSRSAGADRTFSVGAVTDDTGAKAIVHVAVQRADGGQREDFVTAVRQPGGWLVSAIVTGAVTASPGAGSPGPAGSGAQLQTDSLLATIAQQYAAQHGGAVPTFTCTRSGTFAATPGDSFTCTVDGASGRGSTITVRITSSGGAYTWSNS